MFPHKAKGKRSGLGQMMATMKSAGAFTKNEPAGTNAIA